MFNSCAVQSAPKLNNFSVFDLHAKKALKFWVNMKPIWTEERRQR